jgi:hypothetical protein
MPARIAMLRRIIRGIALYAASSDVEYLPQLVSLSSELDAAVVQAVDGMRSSGASWTDIGSALGVSRQAAFQRWAPAIKSLSSHDAQQLERALTCLPDRHA